MMSDEIIGAAIRSTRHAVNMLHQDTSHAAIERVAMGVDRLVALFQTSLQELDKRARPLARDGRVRTFPELMSAELKVDAEAMLIASIMVLSREGQFQGMTAEAIYVHIFKHARGLFDLPMDAQMKPAPVTLKPSGIESQEKGMGER